MSTKTCPYCGSIALVLLTSMNKKVCGDCSKEFDWNLDPGQKPLFEKTKPAK